MSALHISSPFSENKAAACPRPQVGACETLRVPQRLPFGVGGTRPPGSPSPQPASITCTYFLSPFPPPTARELSLPSLLHTEVFLFLRFSNLPDHKSPAVLEAASFRVGVSGAGCLSLGTTDVLDWIIHYGLGNSLLRRPVLGVVGYLEASLAPTH